MSATQVIKKTHQIPLSKPHHTIHNRLKNEDVEVEIPLDNEFQTEEQQTKTPASNLDTSDLWQGEQENIDQDYFK